MNPPASFPRQQTPEEVVRLIASSEIARNKCFDPNERNVGDSLRQLLSMEWERAIEGLGISRLKSEKWFNELWDMHMGEGRSYHTVVHLEEMFHYFRDHKRHELLSVDTTTEDLQIIALSIFFHDAVYDVYSSTNEEESARLFASFAEEASVSNLTVKSRVVEYILATQKHEISDKNPEPMALFLDLDMAVLGKQKDAYDAYTGLIRKEYNYVPHDVYCEKRAEVLEGFLQQPSIYGTHVMQKAFEGRANENLRREIAMLRKGKIPGAEGK